jgi:RND family efflux transporter MFP subunit
VLELRAQLGVIEAGGVHAKQPVSFTLDAFPGETFRGSIDRIDPVADPGTRQVTVYVDLPNPRGRIIGGQYARGFIGMTTSRAVVVPGTAVVGTTQNGTAGSVFVIANSKVSRRAVTLGARNDATGKVAVLTGLTAGEQVIVTPTADLQDGTPITISNDKAQPAVPTPQE